MHNQATTLFNKDYMPFVKRKIIIISLYLMVISWSFTYFAGCIYFGYGEWLKHIPTNINFALIAAVIVALTSIFQCDHS